MVLPRHRRAPGRRSLLLRRPARLRDRGPSAAVRGRRRYPGGSVGSIRAAVDAGPEGLLEILTACGALLVGAVRAARSEQRGFHIFGPADAEASAAMGILETVVHTHDIAQGLGLPYAPDRDVCARVLARLMPEVGISADPWSDLLWATGRAELPGRPRRTAWRWHNA